MPRFAPLALVAALAVPHAAQAGCDAPTSARDLSEASARFYAAWHALDEAAVARARDDAERAVRCIDEPLAAPDIVAWFQLEGLQAFLNEDKTRARDAFRAAQGVLPDYGLPSTVASAGDPWYEMYEALRSMPDDARAPLPPPEVGWVQVDGARAEQHPSARPWMFQQFDGNGRVVQTAIVWTREAPPEYQAAAAADPVPTPAPVPAEQPAISKGLLIGGASAGAAGIAGLASAGAIRARYNNPELPPDRADRLLAPNIALGVLGWTGVAVGAGLGSAAVVVGRW